MEISAWFFVLNIFTSCFGAVYYFAQAQAARSTCSKITKFFILACFASSGVTLSLSLALAAGMVKYSSVFLFFSWFTVALSAYFLKRPEVPEVQKPEPKNAPTQNSQPDNVVMMPALRKGGGV
jgi:hypothetical protein